MKPTQKLLLVSALSVCITVPLLLGWLFLRKSRVEVIERVTEPAEVQRASPALSAEAIAAEGFDLLFKKHDYAGAKARFEACLREFPDYADAHHGLALAERNAGDPPKALRSHERAIELAPERADYYWWLGDTYQRMKDHEAAIKTLELGLQAQNTRFCRPGLLQVTLAQSHRAQGAFQKALEYNEQAIQLNPQSKWYYRERGYTYQALGDRERAEADFILGRESTTKPE